MGQVVDALDPSDTVQVCTQVCPTDCSESLWEMSSAKSVIADLTCSPHTLPAEESWAARGADPSCGGSQCLSGSHFFIACLLLHCTCYKLHRCGPRGKKRKCKSCKDSNSVHPSGLEVSALAHLWGDLKQLIGLSHLSLWMLSVKNHSKHEKEQSAFIFFKLFFVLPTFFFL